MAIRIRKIKGETVALCAAKTKAKKGDIYLDDAAHHALTTKFAVDFESERADLIVKKLMLNEENQCLPPSK